MAGGGRARRRGRGRGWSRTKSARRNPASPSSPEAGAAGKPDDALLSAGAAVEVRVDDDGFHGSWFEATVVAFSPARGRRFPARYTVTYSHLLADDGGGVLAEHFATSHVRPRPPPAEPPSRPLGLDDIVEAFHNDGWWSGIVVAVAPAVEAVTVAFPITREVITFPPYLVRPRRDYIGGEWVPSESVVAVQPKRAVKMYKVGEKVEVGRDREVFGYSWFPATVTKVVDPLSYVVEYFDQEVEGDAGAEKASEYLHWSFIRPAVEHVPHESEFQLRPGAAVEVYCDGAWSPGIVCRAVGDGEYEVNVDGKKAKVLITKVVELLKPQYKWNGKQWKIVIAKRRTNMRSRSMPGKSPSSPVDVASSGDEHNHDHGSFGIEKSRNPTKRPRKESQQQELLLAERLVDVSISDMYSPLTELRKSPERNHSPYSYSLFSGKNNLEAIPNIGQTVTNQEILPVSQVNTPTCGTGVGSACNALSTVELRKKMASACKPSASQQTQARLLSVKALKLNKDISISKRGRTHSVQQLQGKQDASDNSQLMRKEIICGLTASADEQGSSMLDKQKVSRRTRSGSNVKVPIYKKLTKKKGSKEPSPLNLLDADSIVHKTGRENLIGGIKSSTQEDRDGSLEDTYQQLLPLIPPGFESLYHAEGIDINGSVLEEELSNGICQANRNGGMSTGPAAAQVAKSNQPRGAPILSRDHPVQQDCENYHNAGSSHSTVDNPELRRCSVARCSSSQLSFSKTSGNPVPFVKRSPAWSLVEAMDVFKKVPQQPHFLPLREYSVEMREGMALGMMVTFASLVENIREASIEESTEFFEDKISTLCHLESNGFNVQFLQSRLTKLLQIKSKCSKYLGEVDKLSVEMVGKRTSMTRMDALLDQKDEAIGELEQRLACLRQEAQQIENERVHEENELSRLALNHRRFEEKCSEVKQQFRKVLDDLRRKRLS